MSEEEILQMRGISIHAPTRGATCLEYDLSDEVIISIHAPTRGATVVIQKELNYLKFQSTLPREERLTQPTAGLLARIISIHAPTRGATIDADKILDKLSDFNPRSHERSDVQAV